MDLKFWLLKNIPSDTYCARYSSETAGFLTTKKLRLFLQTVFWYRKAKKNRIRSLFPFEFSTKLEARTELMGIWILATVLYGNLLGSALLFSPQNSQHKITQNRVCNAFWWVFEWFSVIVITLEHVGHISLRSNPICSRSDLASRKSSYPLSQQFITESILRISQKILPKQENHNRRAHKRRKWSENGFLDPKQKHPESAKS